MGLDLRCPIGKCRTRDYTAAADTDAGTIVSEQEQLGIVVADIDVSADTDGVVIVYAEKVVLAKKTGVTIARGDKIYADLTNQNITNVATTGYYECGFANEVGASAATTLEIEFDGNLASGVAET